MGHLNGHILFAVDGGHRCLACDVLFVGLDDDDVATLNHRAHCPGRVVLTYDDMD